MQKADVLSIPLRVCLAVLAVSSLSWAASDRFVWPGWQIPAQAIEEKGALTIVEDEEAESERPVAMEDGTENAVKSVLQQRVSRRAIAQSGVAVARSPQVKWRDIVPGVYKVSARVSFDGDTGVIGTPIVLAVNPFPGGSNRAAVSREFTATDFVGPETYQLISFLYEVSPEGDRRLPAREARSPWRTTTWIQDVYPDAVPPLIDGQEAQPPRVPRAAEGVQVTVSLPKTKYQSFDGMPPNSLRWLRVDWVGMERIEPSAAITLRYVRPHKLWLRPGMATGFDIALANDSTEPRTRQLIVFLERGLGARQEVHNAEVTIAPGTVSTVNVPWQTAADTPQWGYKVVAEVRNGNTVESSAYDYFQVHPQCYTVHISGANTRAVDPFRHPEDLRNLQEVFGATPGDMARIMPQHNAWISGMSGGSVVQTFDIVRAMTEHNRREGIMSVFYLFAGGTSTPLMDMYVEHPEWLARKATATDIIYRKIREREEAVWQWDWESYGRIQPPTAQTPHIEVHLSHRYPELKARVEKEFVEFVRATGYDAVRFDVGILSPGGGNKTVLGGERPGQVADPMALAAENFNSLRSVVEAEWPDFEWGANMDSWGYLDTIKDRDAEVIPAEKYAEFIAFAQAGGMFMDEATMSAPLYDHYMNRWEDCWYFMNLKRAIARRHGGVYELFSPHRNGKGNFCHDDIYFTAMSILSGSHYVGTYSAPPYSEENMGAFAMRFSEFLWHPDLRPIEDADAVIFVDAPAEVWYAEGAVQQDIGDRRRYVIPLINPPVTERLRRNKNNELPPVIEEPFAIEVAIPDGFTSGKAWMLSWEPRVLVQPLPANVKGDTLSVTFPGLQICRVLVVEFAAN